jgi:hypothetical protein
MSVPPIIVEIPRSLQTLASEGTPEDPDLTAQIRLFGVPQKRRLSVQTVASRSLLQQKGIQLYILVECKYCRSQAIGAGGIVPRK